MIGVFIIFKFFQLLFWNRYQLKPFSEIISARFWPFHCSYQNMADLLAETIMSRVLNDFILGFVAEVCSQGINGFDYRARWTL